METKDLINEVESQRALLQTYLASDMDIDKMDFNEVVNYAISDVNDQNEFIGHWKDYAFLRGKLEGYREKEKETLRQISEFIMNNFKGQDYTDLEIWVDMKIELIKQLVLNIDKSSKESK